MKEENKYFLIIGIILTIIVIFISHKELNYYKSIEHITSNPFSTINILNTKITPNNKEKTYYIDVDCSNLHQNSEITSFILKEDYLNTKVKVKTTFYNTNNNQILVDNYEGVNTFITELHVFDEYNTYEQIYIINAKCITE